MFCLPTDGNIALWSNQFAYPSSESDIIVTHCGCEVVEYPTIIISARLQVAVLVA